MQFIPCNSALLAQETRFLKRKKTPYLSKDFKEVRKLQELLIIPDICHGRADGVCVNIFWAV